MKFKSKKSFGGILIHVVLVLAGIGIMFFGITQYAKMILLSILLIFVGGLLFVYMFTALLSTHYKVDDGELFIKYGIAKTNIKLNMVMKVERVKKIFTFNCLSIEKLRITYRDGSDMSKIHIAPKDEEEFIKELRKYCKSAKFEK